jgi:hypothetical protein
MMTHDPRIFVGGDSVAISGDAVENAGKKESSIRAGWLARQLTQVFG